MKDFTNKVAVITGSASGVGRSLAFRLGRAGAKIMLADIEHGALETTLAQLREAGIEALAQVTDVSNPESVEALAERSFAHFGEVHLVFNNAGIGAGGAANIWDTSLKAWHWGFNVNVFGVVHGMHSFVPRLIKQNVEAHIVNTASGAGLVFPPSAGVYCATKAAVIAMTEVMHFHLQALNSPVKAAILFPGPHVVDTGLFNSGRNRPAELTDPGDAGHGITSLEDMQNIMVQVIGRRIDVTHPDEVAETAYQGLLEDKYWLQVMSDKLEKGIRDRYEGLIAGTTPYPADIL
jgi:NAD(P)-dependent dehydrogenase (short-subunit alcohol dehydrogenase family)